MAGNREFVYRRLHSLLGVIPVGIFLIQHLVVNHFAASGEEAFNNAAHFMENLPFRYALEIFVIFLPLIYHAVYGVYIAFTAKNNANRFGFFRNWMFVLQRITGIITLIFVSWHVWETRIAAQMGAEVNFDMMADILSSPIMLGFYIVGVLSTIFHFSNGLWSFAVTWGITVSPRSQRIATFVTMGVFVVLSYVGLRAILAFV
ncbi:succinate dehydrogenase cytochrome b558 subunit [Bacillus licheniformis]|jgi:succinate dehydrogenase / fumarate reductase cytochrome b subunit|uniref:Succinate dehydrogenase (Cytochrome b558 subunit) n=2 Tax=Bacillus licheniformis TaxID=1402 RepID=Q65GF3_BACLD|nr:MULTISPECIES: succinate dehydrogenase cytochrome b558 subunit [Bacillus]MBJ7886788.1 succinate dehydrogenase cytochrome b558 subunit [Bacillaceae bacterium HSR45]MDP4082544.1 succinate dehydrogenase cytochrome b558 subunit [Bacillota bacterium]AAU24501.1 succinate dehydrogenase (cytochrome b558 subunit) [Bacillus licheniformis DSM 13 = ATCC 14580]AAU41861.1 succinate dehydrogenase cytochrome b558 subunit SdhC [Bacillus licheniformis DSM 13 = ATCC 14580]AKQ74264.1 succinate dehydrogenase (cy